MKTCPTKQRFEDRIARLRKEGLNPEVAVKPASRFFGESITVSLSGRGAYVAWTLRKAGGLNQRTAAGSFGVVDGRRVPAWRALGHITA